MLEVNYFASVVLFKLFQVKRKLSGVGRIRFCETGDGFYLILREGCGIVCFLTGMKSKPR